MAYFIRYSANLDTRGTYVPLMRGYRKLGSKNSHLVSLPPPTRFTLLSSPRFLNYLLLFILHHAGYLDVGAGKHLHYMLSESEKAPNKDPLVFWFNGGTSTSRLLLFCGSSPFLLSSFVLTSSSLYLHLARIPTSAHDVPRPCSCMHPPLEYDTREHIVIFVSVLY